MRWPRVHRIDPQAPPHTPSLLRRTAGGVVKALAVAVAISGVALVFVHWVPGVVAVLAGIGLMIVGSWLSPGARTGAYTARYALVAGGWRLTPRDALDPVLRHRLDRMGLHHVSQPGDDVSESPPGSEGPLAGR